MLMLNFVFRPLFFLRRRPAPQEDTVPHRNLLFPFCFPFFEHLLPFLSIVFAGELEKCAEDCRQILLWKEAAGMAFFFPLRPSLLRFFLPLSPVRDNR